MDLAGITLRPGGNVCIDMHSSKMSVKVVFATEGPVASRKSALHVFFLEMNTFGVFSQVRPETESIRLTAAHCASMSFVTDHRKMLTGRCQHEWTSSKPETFTCMPSCL